MQFRRRAFRGTRYWCGDNLHLTYWSIYIKELIDRNELIKLFEKYGAEDDAIALIETVPVVLTIPDETNLLDTITE